MPRDIDTITAAALSTMRPLLQEAYEAGRDDGRREISTKVQKRLSLVLHAMDTAIESAEQALTRTSGQKPLATAVTGTAEGKSTATGEAEDARAATGTVKPAISNLLRQHPEGLSVAEITNVTGFKKNSVRGTLWTIKNDGDAERRGERWFAIEKEKAADEKSVPDTSAALFSNPEHDREAGQGGGT